ncbi:unnamed protein product [Ectocarpus fasciculatus]
MEIYLSPDGRGLPGRGVSRARIARRQIESLPESTRPGCRARRATQYFGVSVDTSMPG